MDGISGQSPSVALFQQGAFQSVARAKAVLLPERFRGGCSFGGLDIIQTLSRFVSDYSFQ